MIKPGPRDRKVAVLISGEELAELQRFSWLMSDSFGLDARIDTYQGKRPIGLYQWDFECLLAAMEHALKDGKAYPDKTASGYHAMTRLAGRLHAEYRKTFGS